MVLKAKSKFLKNRNSWTYYLAIPADVVKDSQFPFKPDEEVDIEVKTADRTLVVYGNDYKIKKKAAELKQKLQSENKDT